jgi:hypothetical protein
MTENEARRILTETGYSDRATDAFMKAKPEDIDIETVNADDFRLIVEAVKPIHDAFIGI